MNKNYKIKFLNLLIPRIKEIQYNYSQNTKVLMFENLLLKKYF